MRKLFSFGQPKYFAWRMLKNEGGDIVTSIANDWKRLLDDPSKDEQSFCRFVRQHAVMFFRNALPWRPTIVVVSDIKMASFRVNFALASDERSAGISYHLYKVATPHQAVCDEYGSLTTHAKDALNEIDNWKLWLESNPQPTSRLFPTVPGAENQLRARFRFNLVMGKDSPPIPSMTGSSKVKVWSFNDLTEHLMSLAFQDIIPYGWDVNFNKTTLEQRNRLSSPFFQALSLNEWMAFAPNDASRIFSLKHLVAGERNAARLLRLLKENELKKDFLRIWKTLSMQRQAEYLHAVEKLDVF